ncbi:hypothetical protein SDRG_08206 [Saprolegnia diclina VS20]|uniref:Uncharacterized protein n=1 Tax=Saprolegnia diclina (strain VS20) TaxID=1156394 RepID=T0RVG1_SAPDV|nr:hypothetical protein SDRG_08206 [Saprolegnia diclina VS20]EQC34437.1 hypothetical protein SDRG_08206 [Saprolegnia diclina VS20]|eukprot:XP_008612299.1 hypothetical protein SDRG_08206 [Saprolegnia diclina VS20]
MTTTSDAAPLAFVPHQQPATALRKGQCQHAGCTKAAVRFDTKCIGHGGGPKCDVLNCGMAVACNSRCKRHGGGARCTVDGCDKASQCRGRCVAHGGGAVCKFAGGCLKKTQRGGIFCARHGGFLYCKAPGCSKKGRGAGLCDEHRPSCCIPNCKRLAKVQQLCTKHYNLQSLHAQEQRDASLDVHALV